MFTAMESGITGRAIKNKQICIKTWNPRDFTDHPDRRVDDRPYGGGPGMVMQYEPLHKAITAAKADDTRPTRVIYLSPQGKPCQQADFEAIANQPEQQLIFIAGRYEGIDERLFIQDINEEWSIGDYVLSGGELPAMACMDAITRLLPNVLGDPESAEQDSFSNGLLDHPHYTRPAEIDGHAVPKILQSGDHQAIAKWRSEQRLIKTWQKRPDLIKRRVLTDAERQLLQTIMTDDRTID